MLFKLGGANDAGLLCERFQSIDWLDSTSGKVREDRCSKQVINSGIHVCSNPSYYIEASIEIDSGLNTRLIQNLYQSNSWLVLYSFGYATNIHY